MTHQELHPYLAAAAARIPPAFFDGPWTSNAHDVVFLIAHFNACRERVEFVTTSDADTGAGVIEYLNEWWLGRNRCRRWTWHGTAPVAGDTFAAMNTLFARIGIGEIDKCNRHSRIHGGNIATTGPTWHGDLHGVVDCHGHACCAGSTFGVFLIATP